MISIDESYLKEIPAPPLADQELTNVNVSLELLAVLDINEVDSVISLQYGMHLSWMDPRYTSHWDLAVV